MTDILQHPRLFAAALLAGTSLSAFAGQPVGKSEPAKSVVEKVPVNPLSFFDGKLVFDVQERLRFEIRNNNFDFNDTVNAQTDDAWLLQRFRLGLLYKPTSWLKFYAQGQDSREFESDRPNIPGAQGAEGDDNFDLRQAYIEIGDPKAFPLTLKVGRQVLSYGDERLIGGFDWNNFARTFDAAKISWTTPTWKLDLFAASVVVINRDQFNTSDLFNGNENGREQIFTGAYFTADKLPFGSFDLYALWLSQANGTNAGVQAGVAGRTPKDPAPILTPLGTYIYPPNNPLAQHTSFGTYGFHLKGDPKKLKGFEFNLEAAYQNGVVLDKSLNAFAATGGFGYNFDMAWKPRLWVEYNIASGDADPTDASTETFQNLFPTNHKFYGNMDLFSWQNLSNPMLSLRVSPLKNVTAQLDYNAFWRFSHDDVSYRANGLTPLRPGSPTVGDFVGQELDLVVTWNATKYLQIQGGYSHFFPGDSIGDTGTSDGADFGYLQATVTF